jgi:hypothetical protein
MGSGRYLPKQVRNDHDTADFIIRSGPALHLADAVFRGDGGRSIDLETFTLLSQYEDNQDYTSFVNEAAADGTAIPAGIYMGPTITAADIASSDIANLDVLIFGAWFDESRLVIENAKTLETIIGTGTIHAKTVRAYLHYRGLIPMPTSTSSGTEN